MLVGLNYDIVDGVESVRVHTCTSQLQGGLLGVDNILSLALDGVFHAFVDTIILN